MAKKGISCTSFAKGWPMVYIGLYIMWLVMVDRVKEGGRALGGFNFILFGNFNRNQTENDTVDIGKKILFFCKMFENVQFFSHLHLKYRKSAIISYDPTNFFKYQYGYQKTQNFMLISNSLMPAFKSRIVFWIYSFFTGVCLSRHQRI
jgi:hypothetical protein